VRGRRRDLRVPRRHDPLPGGPGPRRPDRGHAAGRGLVTARHRGLAALIGVAAALGLVVGTAGPAAAHNVSGVSSTNYLTTLEAVTPETPGIEVRVVEKGSRIELTNRNDADVVVLGYEDEP